MIQVPNETIKKLLKALDEALWYAYRYADLPEKVLHKLRKAKHELEEQAKEIPDVQPVPGSIRHGAGNSSGVVL